MRTRLAALALATLPVLALTMSAPAAAQSRVDEDRFRAAQQRYDNETAIYNRERDRYLARGGRVDYGPNGYQDPRYNDSRYNDPRYNDPRYNDQRYNDPRYSDPRYNDPRNSAASPYATDYDAARYYRDDPRYQERTLTANDRVYRGSDGRYYCERNDGTTGLLIGGAGGALLGNVIDGGGNRIAGTLIGGALGALTGRAVDQNNNPVRCR